VLDGFGLGKGIDAAEPSRRIPSVSFLRKQRAVIFGVVTTAVFARTGNLAAKMQTHDAEDKTKSVITASTARGLHDHHQIARPYLISHGITHLSLTTDTTTTRHSASAIMPKSIAVS